MSGGGGRYARFEKLERPRGPEDGAAARSASIASRFGGDGGPPEEESRSGPSRSGAAAERFEAEAAEKPLRVLDLDEGQSFVRCARCRADSHATAVRCAQCDADLASPEQRAFNEAFWKRRVAEQAEERVEVERLQAARARADQEAAAAARRGHALEQELRQRQALGLPLDDADDVRDPLRAGARWIGGVLGRALARHLPGRVERLLAVGGFILSVVALAWLFAPVRSLLWLAFLLVLVLAGGTRRYRRTWWGR
jgi:hypothetical protein